MTASLIYGKHKRHLREFTVAGANGVAQNFIVRVGLEESRPTKDSNSRCRKHYRGPGRAMSLAKHLLSNVNFLFFIYVTQEQQQRAGAKNNCQHQRNHALPLEDAVRARECPKLPNR